MTDFDVLMIGNFAKDKIIVDGVEEITSGGGVYYGSVVVKRLGFKVGVITRLALEDFPRLQELRDEGVEVFDIPSDGTSGIANYYQSFDMERRVCAPIGFGGKYLLDEIPNLKTKVIMLTPLFSGEIDLPVLRALSQRAPVALDIQGFVRVPVRGGLEYQPWEEIEEGLRCVTFLKVDKAEAEYLTGQADVDRAMAMLHAMGPGEIVLTQTSGVTVLANGQYHFAPFTPRSFAGRTGRGDTCFSTYIAMREVEDAAVACKWAGVITSLKQEVPGPWKGSREQVEQLLIS